MTDPAAIVETHTAVVVFVGDRAFKVKKPVDLGFVDFTSVAARREAAHREVELNRRLAPDVYLGVADVTGPDGQLCDHIVVMRRMPADRRLSLCVERGENVDDAVRHVARDIARLHDSEPSDARWKHVGSTTFIAGLWHDCFALLDRSGASVVDAIELDRVEQLVERYLAGRSDLFEQRVATGRIRDGHGDLQADDIFVLPDGPRILDCIEFSEELRWGDVLNDIAFLAMDLERIGAPDLATLLLDSHRELSGDTWPPSLAHHYIAYRAVVRAKVAAIRHEQGDARAADRTRELLDLAHRHLERGRVQLVLIGGLPGTGKSTVARALAARHPVVVLSTDELRPGRRDDTAYGRGRYEPAAVADNYRSMLAEAERLVRSGETVVLDGSWSRAEYRTWASEMAARSSTDLVELCCTASAQITADRIAERLRRGDDPSDATPAVANEMAADFAPWPSAQVIDTSGPLDDAVDDAVRRLRVTGADAVE